MKVYEQMGYTKEEFEAVKAKLLFPKESISISPHLYKQLKDKIRELEQQNFILTQNNNTLENTVRVLQTQLTRANEILDMLL